MISAVIALVPVTVLALAGAAHFAAMQDFQIALKAQQTWPQPLIALLAFLVALAELAVGVVGTFAVVGPDVAVGARPALMAAALVYTGYATYGAFLLKRRPGVPCACSKGSGPIHAGVVWRSVALGAMSIAGAFVPPDLSGLSGAQVAVVCAAVGAYGLAVWHLPAATHLDAAFPIQTKVG